MVLEPARAGAVRRLNSVDSPTRRMSRGRPERLREHEIRETSRRRSTQSRMAREASLAGSVRAPYGPFRAPCLSEPDLAMRVKRVTEGRKAQRGGYPRCYANMGHPNNEVRMDVVPVVFGSGKHYFGSVDAQHLLEDPDVVIQGYPNASPALSGAPLTDLRATPTGTDAPATIQPATPPSAEKSR